MSKYVFGIVSALFIVAICVLGWKNYQLSRANDQINEQLMQANLDLGRANTIIGNAKDSIKKLEANIQKEIKERNAVIVRYGELEAKYQALVNHHGNAGSDSGDPIDCGNPNDDLINPGIQKGMIYQAVSPIQLVPKTAIRCLYSDHRITIDWSIRPIPNEELTIPMTMKYDLNFKLKGQFVETLLPSGAVNHYLNLWEIDDVGNVYGEFKLTKFEMLTQRPGAKQFFWFTPHLDVGLFAGVNQKLQFISGGSAGISFLGYGLTMKDLDWRLLRLGIGFSNEQIDFSISPAQWNIGQVVPLISNLWLGPSIGVNLSRDTNLGILFTVGL